MTAQPHNPRQELIASLAILRVNYDRGSDYLQNFVPFVAEAIRTAPNDAVTLQSVGERVRTLFGLNIPQTVLRTILRRVEGAGYVRKGKGNVLQRVPEKLAELGLEKDRQDALRQYEALVSRFQRYAKEEYELDVDRERSEELVQGLIREEGSSLINGEYDLAELPDHEGSPRARYVLASFVRHLDREDPEGFGYLETVVRGSMLAAALHHPNPAQIDQAFRDLTVYFDTPFLLRALGLYGEVVKAPYAELIKLLRAQGVTLACFERTLDEVQGVLEGIEGRLVGSPGELPRLGEVGENLLATDCTRAEVRLMREMLPQRLREMGVRPMDDPPHQEMYGLDFARAEEVFQGIVGYKRDTTRAHDVEAALAIYRLRHGRRPVQIERSQALFVTTNERVANASSAFFREALQPEGEAVPHTVVYDTIATLVWLKQPAAAPDLPRKRIIADCYAAIRPPEELWDKYLSEIKRRRDRGEITEEELVYMRCSTYVVEELSRVTLNDPGADVEGSVTELLRRVEARIREGDQADLARERAQRETVEAERASAAAMIEEKDEQLRDLQGAVQDVDALRGDVGHVLGVCRKVGRTASLITRALMLIVIGYAIYQFALPEFSSLQTGGWVAVILGGVLYAAFALFLFSDLYARSNRVGEFVERWVATLMRKVLLPGRPDLDSELTGP